MRISILRPPVFRPPVFRPPVFRPPVFRSAVLAVLIGLPAAVSASDYPDQKVVYHNDGSAEPEYFRHLLGNIRNHIAALGRDHVEIRVVDNGGGLDLLQQANDDPELARRIDALRADGVRFLVCANTLKARGIGWQDLYGATEADVIPSGVAEIARLQQQGYAYIHP